MFKNQQINYFLKEWVITLIIAIILSLFIKTFIFNIAIVRGESMYPTLTAGDKLFSNNLSIINKDFKRGDIVVLKAPDSKNKKYIKRIIGISGDTVEMIDGKVILNGEVLKEGYINEKYTYSYGINKWIIPKNEVFVLGDNRAEMASNDSRFFGCVSISSLTGKTVLRVFPVYSFRKLS